MKAVIMAGGEGTRLRPLTSNAPKPMLPLVNRPMMEHIVDLLHRHGIDEIVVTVAYLANHIRNFFGDGSDFGVRMVYATEETPLGTAGSVRNAMDELQERFLVISGDVLTDVDLGKIVAFHEEKAALATIGLVAVDNPLDFGIVITDEHGAIERFLEKPTWGQVFSDTINTGIFVLEPEIFDHIAADRAVDFSGEVFPALLADGLPIYGCVADGYWADVGTLEAYASAHKDVLDGRVHVSIPGFAQRSDVWVGESVDIHPDAVIEGPAVVGDYSRIEAGARVGQYTVLGTNVRVRSGVDLERAIVHDNSYLGEGVRLRGATVGRASDLRRGARLDEGVVLGDECFVGEDAVVSSDVKIYPFKTVEAGAVVNSSIVWESRGARSLFGRLGVRGLANVDITPELAARLAMAYGTTLKTGSHVVISRDSSRAARMLKRAMMSGLNAVGVDALDLEVATLPVTRFEARQPRSDGGISLRLDPDDAQTVTIRFFDGGGVDISEDAQRKIERQFVREDFRRVLAGDLGDIQFPPRVLEDYAVNLEATVDIEVIRERRFKLVIDHSFGATSFVMPQVLAKLNADVLSVNPYASTGRMIGFDRDAAAQHVSRLVTASQADVGVVVGPDGEKLVLIDDQGRVLDASTALLALTSLVATRVAGKVIAVPVDVSGAVEEVASPTCSVVRTKLANADLLAASLGPDVAFAGNSESGFVIPPAGPSFDASATLVHLLEWLAAAPVSLSQVVDRIPHSRVVRGNVVTPWEQKGAVMRSLMEFSKGRRTELIDGVKVFGDDGWVLALPDPEEPLTHLWAEAGSTRDSTALVDEYVRRIRQLIR